MPEPCICYRYVQPGEDEDGEDDEVVSLLLSFRFCLMSMLTKPWQLYLELLESEAKRYVRKVEQLVEGRGKDFVDYWYNITVGVDSEGSPVEWGEVRCRQVATKFSDCQEIYGPKGEFRRWPGEGSVGARHCRVAENSHQEYFRLRAYDISGVPRNMDVPIRCAYFLEDHQCVNCDDDEVRVRPLCYNGSCVRRDHMVMEGRTAYESRQECSAEKDLCNHKPRCLLPGHKFWTKNVIDHCGVGEREW